MRRFVKRFYRHDLGVRVTDSCIDAGSGSLAQFPDWFELAVEILLENGTLFQEYSKVF